MEEQKAKHNEEQQNKSQQRRNLWGSLFTEGELEAGDNKGLADAIRQMNIDGRWFFHQIPLLLLILGGLLLIVTNRYQSQQEMIEKEKLEQDVADWRYRSLTRSSELTTRTRQSQIEERLRQMGDSLLKAPTEPPFTINPNE